MNKKLTLALVGIGMSIGMATTANALPGDRFCQIAKNNANYYCNATDNMELCRYWAKEAQRCGPLEI
ncbi:hypothetical protein [Shewanella waksmanii]|uniref:hypothetical protein n=1 Tax=Shewanella waksmanii TaxID=213783 RepID=UPI00048D3EA5|nr:hypothetical protein [Shewanella waksmanii]